MTKSNYHSVLYFPRCEAYSSLLAAKSFHLHGRCGRTKDAADFAMVLYVSTKLLEIYTQLYMYTHIHTTCILCHYKNAAFKIILSSSVLPI